MIPEIEKRLCRQSSGTTYGHEWMMNLYQSADGFHVEVTVGGSMMPTNYFTEREDAINAGYRTLSDLLGEGR